ncbi:MAG TPA: endonuclease [Dysgonomonas sp.]|nr:endonuclease [Dysgonomonas sp.]
MNKRVLRVNLYFVLFLFSSVTFLSAQTINIASYNIRNDNRDDVAAGNGWKSRLPYVCNLITYHDFDIFGTQEGFYHQLEDIKRELPAYDYIGVGRDDGKTEGEYSAVFFKKDRFELLRSGNFWLSETPDKPELGWDAACIRICTWGEFKDISSGKIFYFFNLHADHVGVEARKESSKLVVSKMKEIAKGNSPVILTGDFNVSQTDESYFTYTKSGLLSDSYDKAPVKYENNGTFNNFNIEMRTNERIDHIFFAGNLNILKYGILTDIYWDGKGKARIPSDHYPVVVKAEFY